MAYVRVLLSRRSTAVVCALVAAACDRPLAPYSVGASTQRIVYGDFVMRVDSITAPTVATAGDTIRVVPHVVGSDACSPGPVVWTADDYAAVVTQYGVRNRPPKCERWSFTVQVPLAPRAVPTSSAAPGDERTFRLFVCRPFGPPLRHDVTVRRREGDPPFPPPAPDSVAPAWESAQSEEVRARCAGALDAVR